MRLSPSRSSLAHATAHFDQRATTCPVALCLFACLIPLLGCDNGSSPETTHDHGSAGRDARADARGEGNGHDGDTGDDEDAGGDENAGGAFDAAIEGGAEADAATDAGPSPSADAGRDAGLTPTACGVPASVVTLSPSNLPAGFAVPATATSVTLTRNCVLDSDKGALECPFNAHAIEPGTLVMLADGSEAMAFVFRSLTIPPGFWLAISGRRPVIIVVETDLIVRGGIVAQASADNGWFGGGAPGPSAPERRGFGTGGGAPGVAVRSQNVGGGGGGFCGEGGKGSAGTAGGSSYGNATLGPLAGGSSGGTAAGAAQRNHGGGAVQMVAGGTITIDDTGVVNMTGGRQGEVGHGGGSGGAILLEARRLIVRGILSANGGGGSQYIDGREGSLSLVPAPGGGSGGTGSAGTQLNGGDALTKAGQDPAGGGGGAGRIRLNSGCTPPEIASSAVVTPTLDTPCATIGSLH